LLPTGWNGSVTKGSGDGETQGRTSCKSQENGAKSVCPPSQPFESIRVVPSKVEGQIEWEGFGAARAGA
jgi:hypothetical protein